MVYMKQKKQKNCDGVPNDEWGRRAILKKKD